MTSIFFNTALQHHLYILAGFRTYCLLCDLLRPCKSRNSRAFFPLQSVQHQAPIKTPQSIPTHVYKSHFCLVLFHGPVSSRTPSAKPSANNVLLLNFTSRLTLLTELNIVSKVPSKRFRRPSPPLLLISILFDNKQNTICA